MEERRRPSQRHGKQAEGNQSLGAGQWRGGGPDGKGPWKTQKGILMNRDVRAPVIQLMGRGPEASVLFGVLSGRGDRFYSWKTCIRLPNTKLCSQVPWVPCLHGDLGVQL